MVGHGARGIYVWHVCPTEGIDEDAVVSFHPGALKQLDVGLDANRHDRNVALDMAAAPGYCTFDPSRAGKADDLVFSHQLHARVPVNAGQDRPDLRSQDRIEWRIAGHDR